MFGNLFEEDFVNYKMNCAKLTLPRSNCALVGIQNQGATCYLNSLLQTLFFTPEFRDAIFSLGENELGSLNDRWKKGSKVRIIPLQLQRLFARLLLSDQQAISTSGLTESFGWKNNEELQQHDVQELNRILFCAIETSLIGTSGKDLISQLYHGFTVSQIICQVCGKISEKEEDFLDLNITVTGFSNLQESLYATFVHKEMMKGKNQYKCSMCCKLVDAKKSMKIRKLPPILTFSLLRFCYDLSKGERYKEKGKFVFPMEINMEPYCDEQKNSEDITLYDLFSIVIHSGSTHGGHYHAYIKDSDCLGKWISPEIYESCYLDSGGKVGDSFSNQSQEPLNVIVSILQQQPDCCLSVDALCSEVGRITGLSWNKRFKKHYGSINKFLFKNDAVFFIDQFTNVVYLKEKENNTNILGSNNFSTMPETKQNATMGKSKQLTRTGTFKSSFWDRKRSQNIGDNSNYNWFDFNDTIVKPIYAKDIETQFSGSESAYMLFYRRKSPVRPVAGRENILYRIPPYLVSLINEENEELQKKRKEYEAVMNTINVQVHFGTNYQYYQGALHPVPNMLSMVELNIDKRKTLAELREQITQLGVEFCPNFDNVIHFIHEVPAGFHLYEELTSSQDLESLFHLEITDGTKLFVWNGKEVGGEIVPVGVDREPILLNVTVTLKDADSIVITRGFSKNMTLGEIKVLLCDHPPLVLEDLVISKIESQGSPSSVIVELDNSKDGMSLIELNLLDGDNIFANCFRNESEKSLNCSQSISVTIENRLENTGDSNIEKLQEIEIDPEQSVADLLALIIKQLSLDENGVYRLRKTFDENRRKPPLHENLTLKEAGIEDNSKLILEKGPSPKPKQITLMFSIGVMNGDAPAYELTIDKKISVSKCLSLMLKLASLDDETWHLRKANWYGEPADPLTNPNLSLEEEGLEHGDLLLIMEGHLPPPGYFTFLIQMYESSVCIQNNQDSCKVNSLQNKVTNGEILGISHYYNNYRFVQLGEVELSAESTLTDLKRQLLTLPKVNSYNLTSVCCLRLWLLEGKKLSHILRGHAATLRKLKLNNRQSLCVQILSVEEDLLPSEILLNVHQRIPDHNIYMPPIEIPWESGKTATIKSLCQTISECLRIPVEKFLIAKYFPEKFEWKVINEIWKKHKTKKKWHPKINLRQNPFYLKDGDIIGVKIIKDLSVDNDSLYDFNTSEDNLRKKSPEITPRIIKTQSTKEMQNLGSDETDGNDATTQQEVGIMIHVEDFN